MMTSAAMATNSSVRYVIEYPNSRMAGPFAEVLPQAQGEGQEDGPEHGGRRSCR